MGEILLSNFRETISKLHPTFRKKNLLHGLFSKLKRFNHKYLMEKLGYSIWKLTPLTWWCSSTRDFIQRKGLPPDFIYFTLVIYEVQNIFANIITSAYKTQSNHFSHKYVKEIQIAFTARSLQEEILWKIVECVWKSFLSHLADVWNFYWSTCLQIIVMPLFSWKSTNWVLYHSRNE